MADQPITEESFYAQRQQMWAGFTRGTVIAVVVVAVLLVLLAWITL